MPLYDDDAARELDSPIGIVGVSRGGSGRNKASDGPGFLIQASSGAELTTEAMPVKYISPTGADQRDAIQALIDVSGAHVVFLGPGTFLVTDTLTVSQDRVRITGAGMWVTVVNFVPTSGGKSCFSFIRSGQIVYQCSIKDMTIKSTDTTYQKIAVRVTDTSSFEMERVAIGPIGGWTGNSSIGLQVRGRDHFLIARNNIAADKPVVIENNPNLAGIDFDVSTIRDNLLIAASGNYNIFCDDGVVLTNVWVLTNSFNTGAGGMYYRDTGAAGQCFSVTFAGNRAEQGVGGGYLLYWERTNENTLNLNIIGNQGGGLDNGFYLRRVLGGTVTGNSITGSGVWINADSTVDRLTVGGNNHASATETVTGIVKRMSASGFEVWQSTSSSGTDVSFAMGKGVGTFTPVGVFSQTTTAGATTAVTTEETLWTGTLRGNSLLSVGRSVVFRMWGTTASNGNTKTIRFKFGATTVVLNPVTTAPNGVDWQAEIEVNRIGATSQYVFARAMFGTAAQGITSTTAAATLSGDVTFSVTGQNGTASASDITLYRGTGMYL